MTAPGNTTPFICRFNAFTPEQKLRYGTLRDWFAAAEVREIADGYAFSFPANEENIRRTAEFAYLEGICCPFLSFTMRIGEDHGSLSLELTGREGVKPFLAAELGLKG